jgi:hypothetical protein
MRKKIVSIFCALALLSIPSSAYSASDTAADEVAYLRSAETAILQAQAFDNDPGLVEALRAIRSVEASFVKVASHSLKEAFAISPRAETKAAIDEISKIEKSLPLDASQPLSGSIKTDQGNADEANRAGSIAESARLGGAVPQKHRPAQEVSWLDTLLSVLAPFLAASVAAAVPSAPIYPSGTSKRRRLSSSRNAQAQFNELLYKMKCLATDLSVPDELILEMRNEARNLRMFG